MNAAPGVDARTRSDRERWRQEVVSRVRQHRARRRRVDPNGSLELDFPAEAALTIAPDTAGSAPAEFVSRSEEISPEISPQVSDAVGSPMIRSQPRKIIHFPRYRAAGREPELAAPVPEAPRILEAPEDAPEAEQMELLPSFADIRLEEDPLETRFDDELDLPSEPASLLRRFGSGVVDGIIVLAALIVFTAIFAAALSRFDEAAPQPRPALLCAMGVAATLWLLFQYLFLVHGKRTPGMSMAGLELGTFDGRRPSWFGRCSRALAATLSGLSLGLGFFWALVDEQTLGWHDRMSRTYLRSGDRIIG